MSDNITEDKTKLKQAVVKVAKCVAIISSEAAVINPIFGVVGSLIRVALHFVDDEDDEDINQLKHDFGLVNDNLEKLKQQNLVILQQIRKDVHDAQFSKVETGLNIQYEKFMEMMAAPPEARERKKDDFVKSYEDNLNDQHLYTLFDAVIGTRKVFSKPVFEVYLEHSNHDRNIMEQLCTHLTHLFCIGLITLMAYAAIKKKDEESLKKKWEENMERVQKEMQEALQKCK